MDITAWVQTSIGRRIVIQLNLLHKIRVQGSNCTHEPKYKPFYAGRLFILDEVSDVLKDFRIEEVRLNHKSGILNDRDKGLDGYLSLISRALILNAFKDQGKEVSHIGLD